MRTHTKIQHNIMEELAFNLSISFENIGVSVGDGIVTLSGRVASAASR